MDCSIRVDVKKNENQVLEIEARDEPEGGVLLYGSSMFTRWSKKWGYLDPREALGCADIVNHGFGGSTAEEQLYYYARLVRPYAPRALVLESFPNDWMFGYSPWEIISLQKRLFEWARQDFPGIRLYLCGVNINKRRVNDRSNWQHARDEYNALARSYCNIHGDCTLIEIVKNPLYFSNPANTGDYDAIRIDIFVEDDIHLNAEGCGLFGQFMRERLKDVLRWRQSDE